MKNILNILLFYVVPITVLGIIFATKFATHKKKIESEDITDKDKKELEYMERRAKVAENKKPLVKKMKT